VARSTSGRCPRSGRSRGFSSFTRNTGILPVFAWQPPVAGVGVASCHAVLRCDWHPAGFRLAGCVHEKHGIVPFFLGGPPPAGAKRNILPRSQTRRGASCHAVLWCCLGVRPRSMESEGLPMPSSRACRQAEPWMAKRGRHAGSGGLEGRSERPGDTARAAQATKPFFPGSPRLPRPIDRRRAGTLQYATQQPALQVTPWQSQNGVSRTRKRVPAGRTTSLPPAS
jgi:hypothetical protein